jgi:hypothetical protein
MFQNAIKSDKVYDKEFIGKFLIGYLHKFIQNKSFKIIFTKTYSFHNLISMSKRSRSKDQNDHEAGHNRRKKPHNNPESNNNDDQNDRNQPNNPRNPQDSSNDKPYDIPKRPYGIYEYLISYK